MCRWGLEVKRTPLKQHAQKEAPECENWCTLLIGKLKVRNTEGGLSDQTRVFLVQKQVLTRKLRCVSSHRHHVTREAKLTKRTWKAVWEKSHWCFKHYRVHTNWVFFALCIKTTCFEGFGGSQLPNRLEKRVFRGKLALVTPTTPKGVPKTGLRRNIGRCAIRTTKD